jgi:2,5-diketo-D-gluconate reductase A
MCHQEVTHLAADVQLWGYTCLRCDAKRMGTAPMPALRPERMRENIDVFDFALTDDEMARIAGLDTGGTLFFDHADPEWVSRLKGVRVD